MGLGAGHWGSSHELWLLSSGGPINQFTTFTVTSIQASNPPVLAVGQSCTVTNKLASVACQATGQFGNVPDNEQVWFHNAGGEADLQYVGLHGSSDTLHLVGDQTVEVGLGAGHYGSGDELKLSVVDPLD